MSALPPAEPMSRFWSPQVRSLVPYVPGEQPRIPDLVKLNTNENPYPPSPRVAEAIARAASEGLQLYPDPSSTALRGAIATACGTTPGQVFTGNGSDEVLALAFHAFFRHGTPLLMPDISYSFYRVYCDLYGIEPGCIPLDAQMRVNVSDYARAGGQVTGVVIANPNAPTGIALPLADIERLLLAHADRVVLVDEAYVDFGAESALALVDRHPNLLVIQTLSKSRSLAGLRVGFAIGQRHLVEALERVKDSFNSYPLDRVAQAGAQAAFEDADYFEQTRRAVIDSRDTLAAALARLGFEVLPSAANFLFVRHRAHDAATLAARLRAQAILVRHFRLPRIEQYLRITVGTPAQCERLMAVMTELLA